MKSPAFQFYAAEFLADENVALMTNEELGCYIKLMCYCWREGSIPNEIKKIGKLCNVDSSAMAELWHSIKVCFESSNDCNDRLVHPRLEKERLKQELYKKERSSAGKKGANLRWNKDLPELPRNNLSYSSAIAEPIAEPMAKYSSSSSSSSSEYIKKESTLSCRVEPTRRSKSPELVLKAKEVLEFLNFKAKKQYRPVDANLALIISRLETGVPVQDFKSVIAKKSREWLIDEKMREYLRPKTLFNKTNFEQYLGELFVESEAENANMS